MGKSIIIIGGGITGLAAGCYGRMNGYETRIFEMHDLPGGVCTSWHRKGYTIDGCIHWLVGSKSGSQFHRLWDELGVGNLQYVDHENYVQVEGTDGRVFTVYTNLDRLEKHMKELAPEDSGVIDEFIKAARSLSKADLPPGTPSGFGAKLKVLPGMFPMLGPFMKWRGVSTADFALRFKNPFLREAFNQAYAGDIDMPMVAMLMVAAWLQTKNAGYPIGGSLEFAKAMERRYLDLGGEISYKSRVEKILTEDGRAVGVRLADGTEHRGDWVISAADGHATIFDMLEEKYIDDKIRGIYDTMTPFSPLVYVGLGVNRTFPDFPHSVGGVNFPLPEPVTLGGKEQKRLSFTIYNYDPTLAPAGKTMVKTMISTDYDWWVDLAKDPAAYQAEKGRIAKEVIAALDRRFPGTAAQVEMVDVATPLTFVRYTGNWRGSFEGWLPKAMGVKLPKTLPGLDHFYMAGQWVSPGGGVPTAGMDGRDAVRKICKRDKKKFATTA